MKKLNADQAKRERSMRKILELQAQIKFFDDPSQKIADFIAAKINYRDLDKTNS